MWNPFAFPRPHGWAVLMRLVTLGLMELDPEWMIRKLKRYTLAYQRV